MELPERCQVSPRRLMLRSGKPGSHRRHRLLESRRTTCPRDHFLRRWSWSAEVTCTRVTCNLTGRLPLLSLIINGRDTISSLKGVLGGCKASRTSLSAASFLPRGALRGGLPDWPSKAPHTAIALLWHRLNSVVGKTFCTYQYQVLYLYLR